MEDCVSTWKLGALAAAMALCAAGAANAAGAPQGAANASGTTINTSLNVNTPPSVTAASPSSSANTGMDSAAAARDAQSACAGYVGNERANCLRDENSAMAKSNGLADTARDQCMRNARLKVGGAGPAAVTPDTATGAASASSTGGGSQEMKQSARSMR
jgi:hypothetical protein